MHCICSYCSSASEWVSPASQIKVRAQHGCVLRQPAPVGGEEGTAAGEGRYHEGPQSAVAELFRLPILRRNLLRRPQLRGGLDPRWRSNGLSERVYGTVQQRRKEGANSRRLRCLALGCARAGAQQQVPGRDLALRRRDDRECDALHLGPPHRARESVALQLRSSCAGEEV